MRHNAHHLNDLQVGALCIKTPSLETPNEIVSIVILCKLPAVRSLRVRFVDDVVIASPLFTVALKDSYLLFCGGSHDSIIDEVLIGIANSFLTGSGAVTKTLPLQNRKISVFLKTQ